MAAVRTSPPSAPVRGKHAAARTVTVISRQRLLGRANGSSAYLLSLCHAIRAAGMTVRLVSPTPATFGRWPAIQLGPEMAVFASIAMRGAWRLGPFLIARDPRIAAGAAAWLVRRLLGLGGSAAPAPYAVGLPVTTADHRFVAKHATPGCIAVIADYAFVAPLIASARSPPALSVVVMHDLFCARGPQFARVGGKDSTVSIDEASELALLSHADCVVAIQPAEAAHVAGRLPGVRVFTVPMAVVPVAAAQPGERGLLFVGGSSSPNADGITWFLAEIWPSVREALPDAELTVVGDAGRAVTSAPAGVIVAGRISDLARVYAAAAVVISPLRAGSGLKIKLIEALGHGKAVVCTTTTVQGVEAWVKGAVIVADDAGAFAQSIITLLREPALRTQYAEAALRLARHYFSADTCHRELIALLLNGTALE